MTIRGTLAVVAALGLAATASAQDDAAQGRKIFADHRCSMCHSIGDTGNKKGPLDDVGSSLSEADIRTWITDPKIMIAKTNATRKPEMKAYALSNDEVDRLVAYLRTLKR